MQANIVLIYMKLKHQSIFHTKKVIIDILPKYKSIKKLNLFRY